MKKVNIPTNFFSKSLACIRRSGKNKFRINKCRKYNLFPSILCHLHYDRIKSQMCCVRNGLFYHTDAIWISKSLKSNSRSVHLNAFFRNKCRSIRLSQKFKKRRKKPELYCHVEKRRKHRPILRLDKNGRFDPQGL